MVVPKGCPALKGHQLGGEGGSCWVEKFAEGARYSFLPTKSVVQPTAGAPEVVRDLLRCRPRPRLWCRGCYVAGWEVWVREVEAAVVELEGEEDVAGCHAQAAPGLA